MSEPHDQWIPLGRDVDALYFPKATEDDEGFKDILTD